MRSNRVSRQQQYIMISSYKKNVAKSAIVVQTISEKFLFNEKKKIVQTSYFILFYW